MYKLYTGGKIINFIGLPKVRPNQGDIESVVNNGLFFAGSQG